MKEIYYTSKFTPNRTRWKKLQSIGFDNIHKSIIGHSLTIDGYNLTIEEGVFINNNVYIECHEQVVIGKNTALGPGATILTAHHNSSNPSARAGTVTHRKVTIGSGCWIGANVTILPGVQIGSGAVIGAGAVVNKNIPAHYLAVGVPAKTIKKLVYDV